VIQVNRHRPEPRGIGTQWLDDHAAARRRLDRRRTGRARGGLLGLLGTARLVDDATVWTREIRACRRNRWNQQNQREQDEHDATHDD
jgi:hypothetical protein